MVHRLNVNPSMRPVKQKKRTFGNERSRAIKEEVGKLLKINYIRPVQYPEWLANVVLVPKANGKWRMCVDFTDLNKACPKDSYPLPRIDALIDSTSGCELMSFLDAFQGYNQIRLADEDQEKTSFVTDQGTFCYNVMPFGLKNAGATYQRLVNNMFREQIGKNMEVYIDDMLVKSKRKEDHTQDLQACFDVLQRNEAPQKIREVQRLTGRLAALNRFISRSSDKGLPFFKVLKNIKNFQWTPECQQAFEKTEGLLDVPPLADEAERRRTSVPVPRNITRSTEYEALLAGIKLAQAAGAKHLEACSDSQLVVNQVKGDFEAKEKRMAQYLDLIRTFGQTFEKFELKRIPRSENEEADQLAKLASSLTIMGSKHNLTNSRTPRDRRRQKKFWIATSRQEEARAIRVRAARFTIIAGDLYKRGFSQPYLKCLDPEKAEYVMREIHEGSCGNHSGGRSLAGKALRQGYFWPSMQKDALDMVRRCKKCQEHANIMHVPAAPMQPIPNPCPFDQWGMDLIGKLPRATGQREYLIVAVDYFSKAFVTDNGTQFQGKEFKRWCLELKIKQYFTSVGTPQSNGQTEVTNRTILQHLKARLDEAKGNWVDELPGVLWAYRTTARKSTGESPFNLIYGTEAIIPAEIGEETLRIQQYKPEANGIERRRDLDLLDEVRSNASIRAEAYKRRMAKAYNTRVRPRNFQVGDLVWRRSDIQGNLGKLDAKWEGPYQSQKQ
ncbi:UNVERIFIED_CONTAM: Transposon Ty3-I Gag-Pol polyprotein [Sesamum radiatum]|uniref:Transposon Ty3-I Gag-Pol polyprotein n=1 Tax=Sesamum radiatum TaxID=300843 RepID=A0AAW2NNR4_SESRA